MIQRTVQIQDLATANIQPNEWIIIQGQSLGNVKLDNIVMPDWSGVSIIDFSQFVFLGEHNLQVRGCENIIVHSPEIYMGTNDDHAILIEQDCDSVFINYALTNKGQNGVKITDGSKNCIIYRSASVDARIDGMECHNGASPCGDNNSFIECEASALQEDGFDITSGQNHNLISCKVLSNGTNNGVYVGNGSSARIYDMNMPDYKLQVKNCEYLEVIGAQNIKQVVFRSQPGGMPQNVNIYGPLNQPIANIENLDLSFLSYKHSLEGFIPWEIRTVINQKLDTVHQYLY